ncbi:MAG: aminodeoxychorismate/anthranilate synthase component II [Pseudomonadota bacterium]|jgi:anthranilate synthase component 2|uniref:anthranilate synthase n=1 Tax=Alteromonas oceani TaxID=2071609 RepID=A0ABV7JY84_9ALTE|nr:aminodeoxychorismate/anthranilate synthase component II [Alteromonas oceani]MDY6927397.1 aminodeoxychorismate/anthranilate synthase component II [Pseudomonadota bacterium]HCA76497.1 anthranilate synthase component II [Alteromonas sp.]HCB10332.1 anthranilate synthase component II [Alteromonas sp.]|tara:strand:- start:7216 stop:7818 length:603 start_codon:yes stop_codon:yes gene_type:complete
MSQPITVFLLDNVDSFTYNLVDELRTMELNIVVYRNNVDARMLFEKMQLQAESGPVLLLLSPGPGAPHEAGCMPELLSMVQGHFPVLGICLGHQAIVAHYGGTVGRAEDVMHGKSSAITHTGEAMFAGMPQPLHVARYHSLMALELPDGLTPLAKVGTTVMAVYQSDDKMLGFQFHPESILTAEGSRLLLQSIHYLTKED